MNDHSLLLILCYVALALLLLILCLATRWPRWTKVGMVVLVTASYFAAEGAILNMFGWPAPDVPPEKFALLAVVIQEPEKERGTKGAIYLWANPIENNRPAPQPRAYRLAYQKEFHATLNEAMKKARNGISQIGSTDPPAGGKFAGWLRNAADPNLKIKISDAPTPQLPEK